MTDEQVAAVCHEANRTYCEMLEDYTQKHWGQAEQWQRDSAIKGVQFARANADAPDSAQHDAWTADKLKDGWKHGPVKNPAKKEHPCLVPYNDLPPDQRRKDALFRAVVRVLS